MKTNKAPEKIYLTENPITEEPDYMWFSQRTCDNDIEYARTDAFIEKACKWIKDNITYIHPRKGTEECMFNLITFKDYMRGE